MATPAYLSIEGETQGNITSGASSDDSIGNTWQEGHEDEVLIQAFDHNVMIPTDPQSGQPSGPRQHKPMTFCKVFDKSSPLLYNALTTGERLTCELKWYRTATDGTQEHYFTMKLEEAVIVDIKAKMHNCQDPGLAHFTHLEDVSVNYRKIEWTHEVAGTSGMDDWRTQNSA